MKFKNVIRYDERLKMFRIGRLLFRKKDGIYRSKISLAIWPKLFFFSRNFKEWDLTIFGVRLHYLGCGGGMV